MIASLSLPNSMWTQIPPQDTSNHNMAATPHTFPSCPMPVPTTMLADGNLTAQKNAHHARTPEKTETMSYDALILIAWNGAKSSLSLFVPPVTNSTPNPTSK